MYGQSFFTTDVSRAEFLNCDNEGLQATDGEPSGVAWDDVETVTQDGPPAQQFETDTFYRLEATVARPIAQPYRYGNDSIVWLKKPREALQKSATWLDRRAWTDGHPDTETGMLRNVDDALGFWNGSHYDEEEEGLKSHLHIPVTSDEAKEVIEERRGVSVGFKHRNVRTDEYDGEVGSTDTTTDTDVDGYQVGIIYDHVASVDHGRCPTSKGCGIERDSGGNHGHTMQIGADDTHTVTFDIDGTTIDATPPESVVNAAEAALDAKDEFDDLSDCGTGVGESRAEAIISGDLTVEDFTGGGNTPIPDYLDSHSDDVSGIDSTPTEWSEETWTDGCGPVQYALWGGTATGTGLGWATRVEEDIATAMGGTDADHLKGGPINLQSEAVDFSSSTDATTVRDTITYDGVMDGELDESEIPNEGYEPHYVFDADTKSESSFPLVDGDGNLRRGNVESAFNLRGNGTSSEQEALLLDVLADVNDAFDDPPIDDENLTQAMSDSDNNSTVSVDELGQFSPAYFREHNESVDEALDERDELQEEVDSYEEFMDELSETVDTEVDESSDILDRVETLVNDHKERVEEARQECIDSITELTDKYDEDELDEMSLDALEERKELVEDLSTETSETTASTDDDEFSNPSEANDGSTTRGTLGKGNKRSTPWDDD